MLKLGQLATLYARPGSGKSMLGMQVINSLQTTAITATSGNVFPPSMNTTSSTLYFDTENSIMGKLRMGYLNDVNRNRAEQESYLEDFEQYVMRAKRIYDCRSLRKPTQGETLNGEAGLESLRIRSTDAIFYYRVETDDDDGSNYFDTAFLKIGDVVFPLCTENADYNEADIFRTHFTPEQKHLDNLPFHRLMEEIIEFYEDYATDYGIRYGSN